MKTTQNNRHTEQDDSEKYAAYEKNATNEYVSLAVPNDM